MINWFNHMYPYTNFHELNLDWVIATVRHGESEIANFIGVNTIKYADPILWNIESQYEANTVVVDAQTGNAYISTKAVPSGVHLSRTDYWTQIYNYASQLDTIREQISYDEGESSTATHPYSVNDLVFVDGKLYRVTSDMIAGDSFVVNSNVVKTTINDELLRRINAEEDISDSIDDEATARENADTALGLRIDDEATARENADTALGLRIDAEIQDRKDEIVGLRLIQNHKILCVADSYGMSDAQGGWCGRLQAIVDDIPGCEVYYIAHSGSGFEAVHDQFITLLNTWIENNPTLLNTITDVIVCGGYNDAYYDLTDYQADTRIGAFVARCNEVFNNPTVHVGMVAYTTETTVYHKLPLCCDKYRRYANKYGAKFIENAQYVCRNSFNLADTRHPNNDGYTLLARFLLQYLVNGYADCIQKITDSDIISIREDFNPNWTGGATGYVTQEKINGLITTKVHTNELQSLTGLWANGFSVTPDGSTAVRAGVLNGFTKGLSSNSLVNAQLPTWLRIDSSTNLVFNVPLRISTDRDGNINIIVSRFRTNQAQTTCYEICQEFNYFDFMVDDSM